MSNIEVLKIDFNTIIEKIYIFRNKKVMLDSDLAEIYGYSTKAFNQQVKNNIEKFDDDFRFQLNDEEFAKLLRSKKLTSIEYEKNRGGRTYRPYVFTEQGIYMLMTVLKGELAVLQSKALIRTFKEMKDYLIGIDGNFGKNDILKLSLQTTENTANIKKIERNMITKKEFIKIIKKFTDFNIPKNYLFFNGQITEADVILKQIYNLAKKSIYIIDNYIGLKSLILLKDVNEKVKITIFSDNIGNYLHKIEYDDFINEYQNIDIDFKITNRKCHDRYIILDYKLKSEHIFHCGCSSKDAGKKITSITEISDIKMYADLIETLLKNKKLEF